jgi:acyl-coenzyme A thioesterase PaaI-like protein
VLNWLLRRAPGSRWYLFWLNIALRYIIPFNSPHGIRIDEITPLKVRVALPFKRHNLNHLRGLHACALATASEFASGILLLSAIGKEYRLIMQALEVRYHFQGRMQAVVECCFEPGWIEQMVGTQLNASDSALVVTEVKAFDSVGNHLCTAKVSWHIKPWSKTRKLP